MTQINVNPEVLQDFLDGLHDFNRNLEESYSTMRARWQSVAPYWNDDQYQQFGEALDEVSRGIERYLGATEGHETHLRHLIETGWIYLGRRV